MGNILVKFAKKSVFSEMKPAGSVTKKHASFPLRFVLYFKN